VLDTVISLRRGVGNGARLHPQQTDRYFTTLPTVAEGLMLRTWKTGPRAGQPKLGPAEKLGVLLADTEAPAKLAAEIDKRIKTIGRSRSFLDWDKRKPLVQELDHLRVTIATRLAGRDAPRAIELLWDFIGTADAVMERVGDGIGEVEDVFSVAMADLGRLSAAQPPSGSKALARRVLVYCERGGFGSADALIRHMSEALGTGGRAEIRRQTEAALQAASQRRSAPWRRSGRCWRRLRSWPRTRPSRPPLTTSPPRSDISGN
jgi:hypothetical protein